MWGSPFPMSVISKYFNFFGPLNFFMEHQNNYFGAKFFSPNKNTKRYSFRDNLLLVLWIYFYLLYLGNNINNRLRILHSCWFPDICKEDLKLKTHVLTEKSTWLNYQKIPLIPIIMKNMGNGPKGKEGIHLSTSLLRCCFRFLVKWCKCYFLGYHFIMV